jgi:hypothetical protein
LLLLQCGGGCRSSSHLLLLLNSILVLYKIIMLRLKNVSTYRQLRS